jgi:FKBP-type peptidyl-prolyl cis-trans isomerase FkpA
MKKRSVFLFLSVALLLASACKRQQPQEPTNRPVEDKEQASLVALNKAIVQNEQDSILHYIGKKHLSLKKDSIGLWYSIDSIGSGDKPKKEDRVIYSYSISLFDGTLCYSNLNTSKFAAIELGKGKIFSGFELALQKMNEGSKAHFIFPSYLCYGVSGDGYKIPPYSPLDCSIHLLKVESKHKVKQQTH